MLQAHRPFTRKEHFEGEARLYAAASVSTVAVYSAFFTGSSRFEQPTGSIAAASVVVTIPIILLVLLFQRHIVARLTAGAIKG